MSRDPWSTDWEARIKFFLIKVLEKLEFENLPLTVRGDDVKIYRIRHDHTKDCVQSKTVSDESEFLFSRVRKNTSLLNHESSLSHVLKTVDLYRLLISNVKYIIYTSGILIYILWILYERYTCYMSILWVSYFGYFNSHLFLSGQLFRRIKIFHTIRNTCVHKRSNISTNKFIRWEIYWTDTIVSVVSRCNENHQRIYSWKVSANLKCSMTRLDSFLSNSARSDTSTTRELMKISTENFVLCLFDRKSS